MIHKHPHQVDVTGIDNHQLQALDIVDGIAKTTSNKGDVLILLRNYAYFGRQRTIHSSGQIEYFHNHVDDRSIKVGGTQCIRTVDGYVIPLDIVNGLPYLKMVRPTDQELKTLITIPLTGPGQWDPKVLDHNLTSDPDWYGQIAKDDDDASDGPFDDKGQYKNRVVSNPSAGDHEVREPGLDDPDGMERPDAREWL